MKRITQSELNVMIVNHKKWLRSSTREGRKLNLTDCDISSLNLEGVNLTLANLSGALLKDTNLSWANLTGTHLNSVHLEGADLSGVTMTGAFLLGVLSSELHNHGFLTIARDYGYRVLTWRDWIFIGCKSHTRDQWESFSDKDISHMDSHALEWWKRHKDKVLSL